MLQHFEPPFARTRYADGRTAKLTRESVKLIVNLRPFVSIVAARQQAIEAPLTISALNNCDHHHRLRLAFAHKHQDRPVFQIGQHIVQRDLAIAFVARALNQMHDMRPCSWQQVGRQRDKLRLCRGLNKVV